MAAEMVQIQTPRDPRKDPNFLRILRWLMADKSRILPPPEDETGILELSEFIGKSAAHTRTLMAWSYGARPGAETCKML
jgi:hypothetical protein